MFIKGLNIFVEKPCRVSTNFTDTVCRTEFSNFFVHIHVLFKYYKIRKITLPFNLDVISSS